MEKREVLLAYGEIVRAIAGLDQLREAIRTAKAGYGLAIPSDADVYIAKIHNWILEEQSMLLEEMSLVDKKG